MFPGQNKTLILLFTALALTLFLVAALALDGSTTNALKKTTALNMHGGYGMNGDICEQCHDINDSSGNYTLSRWRTFTDICGSCHYLYADGPARYRDQSDPPGSSDTAASSEKRRRKTPDLNYQSSMLSGSDIPKALDRVEKAAPAKGAGTSVGSPDSAYEYRSPTSRSLGEHILQRGPGRWLYTDKPDNYQGSDYVPGGASRLRAQSVLDRPGAVSVLNFAVPRGLYCGSCHIPHGDAAPGLFLSSDSLPSAATILAIPQVLPGLNNSGDLPSSLTIDGSWATGGGQWCAECHDRLFDNAVDAADGAALHNHPDFACLTCHADAVDDLAEQPNTDFPHTGYNPNPLAYDEDSLCVTCHVPGSIP